MKCATFFLCYIHLLGVCLGFISTENLEQFSALVHKFADNKNVHSLTIITCQNSLGNLRIFKKLSLEQKYRTSIFTLPISSNFDELILNDTSRGTTGFVLDMKCPTSKQFLENRDQILFASSYRWLLLDMSNTFLNCTEYIGDFFQNVSLRMDSDLTVAVRNSFLTESVDQYDLYDLYNPGFKIGGKTRVNLVGFWNFSLNGPGDIIWVDGNSKYRQRIKMDGVTLRTPTVITRQSKLLPAEYLTNTRDRTHDTINKFSYSVFVHVQEIHNFSVDVIVATAWFGNTTVGDDAGLSHLLNNDLADVASTCGLMKKERIGSVDFIIPLYPFKTCFLFRNSGNSGGGIRNIFLEPFAPKTWEYVLGACLGICLILKFSYWLEKLVSRRQTNTEFEEDSSLTGAAFVTWAAVCQQGTSLVPPHVSGRIIFLSLLTLTLLLYNYYTSSVVSSLLSSTPPGFQSLAELAQSKLQLGVENIIYVRTLFQVSRDPVIRYLYRNKIFPAGRARPAYFTPEEGIARVKKGGFGYHTETTTAYSIIERTFEPAEICDLKEIPVFPPSTLAIMGQRRGQYYNTIAVSVRRIIEAGIVNRQLDFWQAKKPSCLSATSLVKVGLPQTSPALLVLALGILISIVVWLGELLFHRYKPLRKWPPKIKAVGRNLRKKIARDRNIIEFYN